MDRALSSVAALTIIFFVVILGAFGAYVAITLGSTESTCVQSAESQISLTVVNDSSAARLKGVQVTGNVKWLCGSNIPPGYFIASQSIGTFYTSSNGTLLIGSTIGNYSLTLRYSGHSYHANFSPGAEQNVNVTVSLPSDRILVEGCVFGDGICFNETTPNGSMLVTTITTT